MLKGLLKESFVYGFANGIQKLVPFFLIPVIIQYLGQQALKIYDVSFVYAYLLSWLIILGQDNAASVFYFDNTKTSFNKKQVLGYGLVVQLVFLIFAAIFIYLSRYFIGGLLFANDAAILPFWFLALLIVPAHVVLNYSLNILLWQKQKRKYIFVCFCQTVISIVSVFIAVVLMKGDTKILFYCIIGSTWLSSAIAFFLIKNQLIITGLCYNHALVKKLLGFGVPFALTSFLHQALPSADRYFLLENGYSQQLPLYIVAVKLGGLLSMIISAFVLAFTPWSMSKLNDVNAEEDISTVFHTVAIAAFMMVPVLLCFKELMLVVFANSSFQLSGNLLPFFFFGWVFDLFSYFSMLGIYKSQNSFLILLLFAGGVVLLSALNLLLIPKVGLYGSAVAFCISKAALFFAPLFLLRRHFKLAVHTASFTIAALMAATCTFLIYNAQWYAWGFALLLAVAISVYYIYYLQYKKLKPLKGKINHL